LERLPSIVFLLAYLGVPTGEGVPHMLHVLQGVETTEKKREGLRRLLV
jgi:hypothetical protein